MQKQTKQTQSFDVFSNKTGSWQFLCAVEAQDAQHAKQIAMSDHNLTNWNGLAVYLTK